MCCPSRAQAIPFFPVVFIEKTPAGRLPPQVSRGNLCGIAWLLVKLKDKKNKIWQQGGKPNELFFLAEFHPSSVDEMVLLGLAALQHPGTAPPRMCPLEYTKEMPSTLPCPPCWAAPANNGDKNCINFKGKKSRYWHCLPGTSPQEVFLAKR